MLATAGVPLAHAQQLPPGATPGGVEPEQRAPRPPAAPGTESDPRFDDGPAPPAAAPPDAVRVPVAGFRLTGAVDREEHGVLVADIEARMAEALREHGGDWSLADLQGVAESVTAYYAARGFVLTRAYLPQQSISDGEVEIRVVEGMIGRVLVEGNEGLESRVVEGLMAPVVGRVARKADIESALLQAGDLPGVTGRAVLQPGAAPGTADLVYRVTREERFEAFANADNYGSEFVGGNRVRLDLVLNNPLGDGDQLTLSGLKSFDPANSDYAGLAYTRPWIPERTGVPVYWGLSGSRNEYEVGADLEDLGLEGESSRLDLHLDRPYARSRFHNRTLSLALAAKQSRTFQRGVETSTDKLTTLVASHHLSHQNRWLSGGLLDLGAAWTHGFGGFLGSMAGEDALDSSRLGGSGIHAGAEFDKVTVRSSYLQRFRRSLDLRFRVDGQLSEDLLVSLEQFPLGGPGSVRAYPLSAFLVDKGVYASAELSVTPSERLRLSAFYDYATGSLNDPLPSDIDSVTLQGAGAAIAFQWPGRLSLRISAARPVGEVAPGFEEDDDVRVFALLNIKLM